MTDKMNLHQQAAVSIRKYIRENQLNIGDKLPSQSELMEILGLGRSSLREALRLLEGMGLLQILVGKGIYVRNAPDFQASIPLTAGEGSMLQVLEVRKMIERCTIELAIKHATPEDLATMENNLNKFEALAMPEAWAEGTSEADYDFHQSVYASTHNPVLIRLIHSISDQYNQFWNPNLRGLFYETVKHHRLMFLAIKSRDYKAGQIIVEDFIQALHDGLNIAYEKVDPEI